MKRMTIALTLLLAAGCGSKPVPKVLSAYDKATDTVAIPRKPNAPNTSASSPEFTITGELSLDDIVSYYLPRGPNVYGPKINEIKGTLKFSADSNGQVDSLIIIRQSAGYSRWDNQFKKALMKWKFKPSKLEKRSAEITFTYSLEQTPCQTT
ncbi:TonB family protein [candidate division WOR-3 bacterium]|nr:TonB family protein [candidate division WOR-3 bacterium]